MIAKNIEMVEIDNEWIIMDAENFTVTKVNAVGADILAALIEQQSIDEIINKIQLDYNLNEHAAKSDVFAFIEELKGVGLITNEGN